MEINFHGKHSSEEAIDSLLSIIRLFHERYQIDQFREMHLSITLVDETGSDVELVDNTTNHAYRVFDVYRHDYELSQKIKKPVLKLVVDNTELVSPKL